MVHGIFQPFLNIIYNQKLTLVILYFDAMKSYERADSCYINNELNIAIKSILSWVFFSEPVTEILGSPELFINQGSTINLTCIVHYAPEPPPNIAWSQNSVVINFDSPRGGISLVTEKGFVTTSRLLIQKAKQTDSGVYTCTPSNANAASIRVHILNGKSQRKYCIYI